MFRLVQMQPSQGNACSMRSFTFYVLRFTHQLCGV